MKTLDSGIQKAVRLLEIFSKLLRASPTTSRWMADVAHSRLPEFQTFVAKLRQELTAVLNALHLSWSQGQTEGKITKLRLLKRSMDGRGGSPCSNSGYCTPRSQRDCLADTLP